MADDRSANSEGLERPDHLRLLEDWMRSYKPEELFDPNGTLIPELAELPPKGQRRMGMNPHTNGGRIMREVELPDFRSYAVDVPQPGAVNGEATRVLGDSCEMWRVSIRIRATSASWGQTKRHRIVLMRSLN